MEPVQGEAVCSKSKCNDIAAKTLIGPSRLFQERMIWIYHSFLNGMNLSFILPISAISNGDLGVKLITIMRSLKQSDRTGYNFWWQHWRQMVAALGAIDHFLVAQCVSAPHWRGIQHTSNWSKVPCFAMFAWLWKEIMVQKIWQSQYLLRFISWCQGYLDCSMCFSPPEQTFQWQQNLHTLSSSTYATIGW